MWMVVGSVLFFIVGLVGALATVVLLPDDFFINENRKPFWGTNPIVVLIVFIVRNVVGVAVIIAGVVMLFTPGQGLLTILIGLMLVTIPGKHHLMRSIVGRPAMITAMNKLRARFNRPPLILVQADGEKGGTS